MSLFVSLRELTCLVIFLKINLCPKLRRNDKRSISQTSPSKRGLVHNLMCLKGHSQLGHMRIRYQFISNLHITETRSILFLTSKSTLKNRFSVHDWFKVSRKWPILSVYCMPSYDLFIPNNTSHLSCIGIRRHFHFSPGRSQVPGYWLSSYCRCRCVLSRHQVEMLQVEEQFRQAVVNRKSKIAVYQHCE